MVLFLAGACSSHQGVRSPAGVHHTVRQGETLYRISRTYGVDERHLARINGIDNPTQIRIGQRLFIPGRDRVRAVPSVPSLTQPKAVSAKKTAEGKKKRLPAPQPKPAEAKKEVASVSPVESRQKNAALNPGEKPPVRTGSASPAQTFKGKFGWPLQGEILKTFGKSGNTPSQGVEISAPRSSAVRSAAAGRVIYSGDGIRSYGNLVILKHDESFFTVYGFNEKNIVQTGAFVSKGDKIALSGAPPIGGKPRLYFEIRHGKEPVNPIFYLP